MIVAFIIPGLVCFTYAVIQAMRKQWKNSAIGMLLCIIIFLLFSLFLLSHSDALRRARLSGYERKITELEQKAKDMEIERTHSGD